MGTIVKLLRLRLMALSTVALLSMVPAAFALDAGDFTTKLQGMVLNAPGGTALDFKLGAATVSGDSITFAGLTLGAKGSPADELKTDVPVTFTGVAEQADGSYTATAMTFPDQDIKTEDGGEVTIKSIKLGHILVPSGKSPNVLDSSRFFGEAGVGPITVMVNGAKVFGIDSFTVTNTFKPGQADPNLAEIDSQGVTAGMKMDMSTAPDPQAVAQMKALDLLTITGKFLESMSWTTSDGHLNISEISTDIDKVGKLKFGLDITGYTPAFLQNLSTASQAFAASAAAGTDNTQATQAATAMLLAAAQTLFLNGTTLRFDDASITSKLLDIAAKQANVDRATLINQAVAMLPAIINENQSSPTPVPVVQTVQAAARAYLNDPHSVEVKLAPKAPLGVLGIVAAVLSPATLTDQIGLKILVNDKEITPADAAKETGVAPAGAAPATGDDTAAPSDNSSDNSDATDPSDNSDSTANAPSDDNSGASDDSSSNDNSGASDDSAGSGKSGKEQSNH